MAQDGSASSFSVFSRNFYSTFTVPDARHGGRGRAAGLHCVHQRSAAEPPTVWWGRRETRHPQGAEDEIPGLQGREEKTVKEDVDRISRPSSWGTYDLW